MNKIIKFLIAVIVLSAAGVADIAFCQPNPPAEGVNLTKEELKFEMKPAFKKAEKRESIAPKVILPKAEIVKQADAGKAQKEETRPKEEAAVTPKDIETKEFKSEVGIAEVIGRPLESATAPVPSTRVSVDECIKIAIRNHIPLQIAEKSVGLAKMRLWEARRKLLPTLSVEYDQYGGEIFARQYTGRKQFAEFTQPIFHGGELYFSMKQAEVNLEVVKNEYDRVKNELILQVRKAYYSLAKTQENFEIQKQLFQDVNKIADVAKQAYDANIASKLELLNVGSQTSQVHYQLKSAEGDISVAELILKQSMNLDTKDTLETYPIPDFKKQDVEYDKLLAIALVNRPEMKINSLMMDYYTFGKRVANAKTWPQLDFQGMWGLAKEEFRPADMTATDIDQKLEQQWYWGVKSSIPIWGSSFNYAYSKEQWTPVVSAYQGTKAATHTFRFNFLDKLDTLSGQKSADIDFDKARQDYTKARQDVTLEVKENYFNYLKALIQLDTAANKVEYQKKDLELTRFKREMDEAPDSAVIESMLKLAQEKFGYLQALSDCHTSVAALNKAMGRDVVTNQAEVEQVIEAGKRKIFSEPKSKEPWLNREMNRASKWFSLKPSNK